MGWEDVAGSVAGALLGSDIGYQNTRGLMNHQQSWQEYMSNTAYQRSWRDMQAAGLNPIMAFSQGGASTPGGGGPSVGGPDIVGALATAKQLEMADKQEEKMDAEIGTEKTRQGVMGSEIAKNLATANQTNQATDESKARTAKMTGVDTESVAASTAKVKAETQSASAKAFQDQADAERRKQYGPKSVLTDTAETVDTTLGNVIDRWKRWLGISGDTPKEAAQKDSKRKGQGHGATGSY